LPPDVRSSMRSRLDTYASVHAVPIRSPYTRFSFKLTAAFATLLLFVLTGTGVTYAAEKTVPGDSLYIVKRSITEPVLGALARDTQAKAAYQTQLAERRLEEATTLALEDRLDQETSSALTHDIEVAADSSTAYAGDLEMGGDEESALIVRSELEARLAAHADILERVADQEEELPVYALAKRISERVSMVSLLRAENEEVVEVEEELDEVQVATVDAVVEEIADEVEELRSAKKPSEAFVRSQEAVRASIKATIFERQKKVLDTVRVRTETRLENETNDALQQTQ
ncbi:hypothetical protein KKH15_02535, partial [Patescibacteria group bacterium]|nr:hypothetical protein [Patescibacteria group bacterium]